jgi:hypothetical protein
VKACPFLKDNDVDAEEVASLMQVIGADEEGDSKRAGEAIRLMHQKIIQQKNTIEKDTATIETSMLADSRTESAPAGEDDGTEAAGAPDQRVYKTIGNTASEGSAEFGRGFAGF